MALDHADRNHSSLSEFENLSDSDWLDVASSRASEDDDSLTGFEDSDRDDVDGRPESRYSYTSYSSSRDEVVAWEGLIDENSDLETPLPLADRNELTDSLATDLVRPPSPQADEDPEDERVKAALDQSMISTLSSSRSNSLANSVQTSMGNSTRLRLSFPDPTTSRPQSLSTSYEDLSHSEAKEQTKDDMSTYADAVTAEPAEDPGLHPTPVVPAEDAHDQDPVIAASRVKPDLRVVLYGASPLVKDTLVRMLLDKLALSTGLVRAQTVNEAPRVISHIFSAQESKTWKSPLRSICVVDKTGLQQSLSSLESDCPSLAVVFLPSFSEISLLDHTLYLPVMTSSPLSVVDFLKTTDYLLEAEQQWEDLGIPSQKLTCLSQLSSPVVDQETLENTSPAQVYHALRPLIPASIKRASVQVSAYAVAIMTVLSIVLGYVVNGCMDSQSSLHKAVAGHAVRGPALPWWSTSHVPMIDSNKSTASSLLAITSPITAVSASSLKDFAVAVFNPTSPSIDTTASGSQPVASCSSPTSSAHSAQDAPSECDCGCGLLTWPGKTDVMVRPTASPSALSSYATGPKSISVITTTQLHTPNTASQAQSKGKGKEKATDTNEAPWGPGLRLIESYLADATKGALAHEDVQDLVDALDRLMQVIAQQTAAVLGQSHKAVAHLRGGLRERNERAKARARQIRETGVQWLAAVGEHVKGHAAAAKVNARAIRERLTGLDVEEVGEGMRARRQEKKQKRKERKEQRKEKKQTAVEEKRRVSVEKRLERQEKKQARRMQRFMRAIERAG